MADDVDDERLLTMYRSWSPGDLAYLRHAFKLDLAQAEREHNDICITFCRGRLALIDQVFKEWEQQHA